MSSACGAIADATDLLSSGSITRRSVHSFAESSAYLMSLRAGQLSSASRQDAPFLKRDCRLGCHLGGVLAALLHLGRVSRCAEQVRLHPLELLEIEDRVVNLFEGDEDRAVRHGGAVAVGGSASGGGGRGSRGVRDQPGEEGVSSGGSSTGGDLQ